MIAKNFRLDKLYLAETSKLPLSVKWSMCVQLRDSVYITPFAVCETLHSVPKCNFGALLS